MSVRLVLAGLGQGGSDDAQRVWSELLSPESGVLPACLLQAELCIQLCKGLAPAAALQTLGSALVFGTLLRVHWVVLVGTPHCIHRFP